ncbi:MAG: hypothetical protein IKD70_08455, partial [Eggerthellaceae bacterium]|nr:hypothetical protein [Eggerthellaceae bacterium]
SPREAYRDAGCVMMLSSVDSGSPSTAEASDSGELTTAIMLYTNRGSFSLGIALGIILMTISLVVNVVLSLMQRRLSK